MVIETMRGELRPEAVLDYVLAGNATFTLLNTETGGRLTYRVQAPKDYDPNRPVHFVKVLTGQDNLSDYTFLGTIFNKADYRHGRKSPISLSAPSAMAFSYFWGSVIIQGLPASIKVFHEGRCGRCGRTLTVPESVASGYGPECAEMIGLDQHPLSKRGAPVAPAAPTPAPAPAPEPRVNPVAVKREALSRSLQALGMSAAVIGAALDAFDAEGGFISTRPVPADIQDKVAEAEVERAQERVAFESDAERDFPSAGVTPVERWAGRPLARRKPVKLTPSAGKALEMIRQQDAGWLTELAMSDEEYAAAQRKEA